MNFSQIKAWKLPEGAVTSAKQKGSRELWNIFQQRYVSLGDSIAAGHTINEDWERNYGYASQYGENGNTSTAIVPNSYTDLIRAELANTYGAGYVKTTSFAHSGDTVADLLAKLDHEIVRRELKKATLVTICIGANDVLQPAMLYLEDYINGNTDTMLSVINSNLSRLNNDSDPNSYHALLNKLYSINPNAQYVFTTIYNPYKYLWLEESTSANDYKDGFLGPLMWAIPDSLGSTLANGIRSAFLKAPAVTNLFTKINEMPIWAESFVASLNNVIKNKVAAFGKPNFIVADTKAVFDPVPDRTISSPKHYNDLVSVEFTRGFVIEEMDWGKFWLNTDWGSILNNINSVASVIIDSIVNEVIIPDVDPHPEWYGHYAMKCSFADALGWSALPRRTISFYANGGSGTMASQTVIALDNMTAYTNINDVAFTPSTGYRFTGWKDQNGVSYSNKQLIGLNGDLSLTAQWSNTYAILFKHTNHTNGVYGPDETGHKECYALWIDGEEQEDFGKFSEGSERMIYRPYGSQVGVVVSNYNPSELTYDDVDCNVYFNGSKVASGYRGTNYTFTLTSDVVIDFQWHIAGSLVTFNAQSWEDCYITTK